MSTTYSLCCYPLKLKLWVGQSGYIYNGEEATELLAKFLHATKGHPLLFVCDYSEDDEFLDCADFKRAVKS